jgi:hypothetical protein
MRTKEKNLSFRVPCIKIFLDDIENIIKIMSEGGNIVKISDDRVEYDSLDELIQKNKAKLAVLYLKNNSPYISLDLKRGGMGGGRIYSSGVDGEPLFFSLKEFLLQKRRWFSFLTSRAAGMIVWITFYLSFFCALYLGKSNPYFYNFGLLFIISIILILANYFSGNGYFTLIDLSYSYKKQSLYERYRDLINGIICIILGAIITWLLKP